VRSTFSGGLTGIHFAARSRSTSRRDQLTSGGGILIHSALVIGIRALRVQCHGSVASRPGAA
jgi:hypothetical protein